MTPGTRLGPYEVVAKLGEGGMGEVYKGRDTRLDRDVALKVSKEEFSERFEREARAVAALNHPNICALYDVGPNYLVMELVDGGPLAGPLPVEKAVEYAGQILDALEAAHRQGITHRDLKPANILVTKQGIKLLDFGLATKASPLGASSDETVAAITQQGQIVGTLQYMAPEQLQAQPADARSDIFAFGCVLYEILSGKRAFDGSSPASVIAAILEREPAPLERHPPLDRVIRTCLAKDPDGRFQNASDLKRAMAWAMEPASAAAGATPPVAWWQKPVVITGAVVLAAAAGLLVSSTVRPMSPAQAPTVTRFELPVDPATMVWSPDGTQLAWLTREATPGAQQEIFVRRRDDFEAHLLDVGAGQRHGLAFSPDGEWLAYTHAEAGRPVTSMEVRKVRVTGGVSELVARVTGAGGSKPYGALAWEAGHVWLASGLLLQAIPESGGTARTAITLPVGLGFVQGHFQTVNGGRDLLFVASDLTATGERSSWGLWTAPVAGGEPREVMNRVISFALTPGGDLVYTRVDGLLWGQRFREDTIEAIGEPVSLVEVSYAGMGAFALSPTGMLAYHRSARSRDEPVWLQRASGRVDPVHASLESSSAQYYLSPDGRFVLTTEGGALRAWDLERQQGFQVVTGADVIEIAVQTQAIFFQASEVGTGGGQTGSIFRVDFPWTSPPVEVPGTGEHRLRGVSPDGRRLIVAKRGSISSVLINADGTGEPVPFERFGTFSPDGRWVHYGNSTGLWVRPEPAGGQAPTLIGQGNFARAFWSPDGRELFYPDDNRHWVSVTVRGERSDAPLAPGRPVPLNVPDSLWLVALSPDGKRFLATRELQVSQPKLAIVEHFFEELRAKVPVK